MLGRGLGQFYPAESPVHRLDPRAKIVAAGAIVAGLFLVDSMAGFLVIGGAVVAALVVSRVPVGSFLRAMRPVLFILVITSLFQILFYRRGELIFGWGWIQVYTGGVELAAFLALRLALLISATTLLTATTSPLALADGLEDLLSPLSRLRFPAHELAMMMSIALRFIPTLSSEAEKVMKAQAARGAEFSEGGLLRRARALVPVLVPLTIGAFKRADELAEAMESRGYRGGAGRTRYRELRFRPPDAAVLALAVAAVAGGALV
ncbi:energy-coupling factor transporter transmembrane protein EcfT [Rubrobacter taiwanensis]|uniref:Energy-coupling factor transporter transmembrane protein EcfT n=1 Tax=Rubrobacter taiwanensis TaxID=185139 RepID=A0A4R1BLM9_9ACTN|nr:energy-coupling factor transporter transmembrane component T [Rubrobacter taiwanensis]TCJ18269.1 energy-coupling factor transporter transmembrane protein EcfT [Rubrobacter taiwanensis]